MERKENKTRAGPKDGRAYVTGDGSATRTTKAAMIRIIAAFVVLMAFALNQSATAQSSRSALTLQETLAAGAYSAPDLGDPDPKKRARQIDMLAWLMLAENGNRGFPGAARVGAVALNRLCIAHKNYGGGDLFNVITRPSAFSPLNSKEGKAAFEAWVNSGEASAKHKAAYEALRPLADALLRGWRPAEIPGNTYHFQNLKISSDQSWYAANKVIYAEPNGHEFMVDIDGLGRSCGR